MKAFKIMAVIIVAVFLSLFLHSWYTAVKGTVVDSETGMPIEGAIIYAHWSITRGVPGLSYGEDYSTHEAVSDHAGRFKLPRLLNPFINPPNILIYKAGYTAWNNKNIFPTFKNRIDWVNGAEVKLIKFTPDYLHYGHEYNHYEHVRFIRFVMLKDSIRIREAVAWEEKQASQEAKWKRKIEIIGKIVDAQTGEPISNAICAVADNGTRAYLEFFSDDNGNITISGEFPLISPPYLIIYKKGYIAWDRDSVFPNYHGDRRRDFQWQEAYTFKLEKWDPRYSHNGHYHFIFDKFSQYHPIHKGKLKEAVAWEKTD